MFRKTVIAIVATATIAAVALPTAAFAKKGHHHRHGAFVIGLNFVGNDYSDCGWEWVRVSRHYVKKVYVCY